MRQMRGLGVLLRSRYDGFINASYVPKELHVRSSDTDRTLMSATSLLSGLYPPVPGADPWLQDNLAWQPIPVHSRPLSMDYELYAGRNCPLQDEVIGEVDEEATSQVFQEFPDFMNTVVNNTGGRPLSLHTMFGLADTLYCMHQHPELGFKLPDWVTPEIDDWFMKLMNQYGYVLGATERLKFLNTGPLLEMLGNPLKKFAEGEDTSDISRLYLYATHDIVILELLQSLGLWNERNPPYGCVLVFELHETQPGKFSVEIYFKNDTIESVTSLPTLLTVPGCEASCPVERFFELTAPYTFTGSGSDWEELCDASDTSHSGFVAVFILSAIVLCLAAGVSLVLVFLFVRKAHMRKNVYNTL